jgi:hypothetical protein
MEEAADTFDSAFSKAVDLGNRLAGKDKEADLWDIADGLLAGAVQYWLYSRQPCGDPRCEDCVPISTADARMAELKRLIDAAGGRERILSRADRRQRRPRLSRAAGRSGHARSGGLFSALILAHLRRWPGSGPRVRTSPSIHPGPR